ncbi:MAG: sigma-54-dependent Fis family transcriptional regulator [Planctomycetia bacterium]|nr:sigma-54-dependent Fis family transcriptional regulator [Planctomycetia bacterium]
MDPHALGNGAALAPVLPPLDEQPRRRILLVEDNETARQELQRLLETDAQLRVDVTADGAEALQALARQNYSIVITDLRMPRCDGMELIRAVQERRLPVTVIVTTGHGSIDEAVQAIRLGAYDFLTKPIDMAHLRLVLQRALRERALQDEIAALRTQLQDRYSFQNVLSKNARMHAVFELVRNVADSNTTVLIEGETGTGKEQIARAIHESSSKRAGPLVAINCAAVPENLLESELFGHEKGAFTSAVNRRQGRFELAHGGTLFLDEVGDVPLAMQAKLLRVLQERRFERVGGTEVIEVDVRVIAATNRSLQRLVKQGAFREDLFYRLNVVKIDLPPLRERPEDIPLLATHFAQKYARPGESPKQFAPRAMEVLLGYSWPGNVRELENAIERASVTSRDQLIQVENLPPELLNPAGPLPPLQVDLTRSLPELLKSVIASIEQQYIRKALKKAHGHVGRCARICGLSRRSITSKIAEYKLDKAAFRE